MAIASPKRKKRRKTPKHAVVISGEDKAVCGEGHHCEQRESTASEFSMKRKPPVSEEHTTDAEAAVEDKTTVHRMAGSRRALAVASNVLRPAGNIIRSNPPKGAKELNLGC